MSESHRDHDKSSSNTSSSHTHRNDTDDMKQSSRKRSHLDIDDVDAKVYVGNLPTEALTDNELLNFFKPYGKVSDIRVYKNHVFVQYMRTDDAKRLIKEGQVSLTFKGNKLEILPARDVRSTSTKSSSTDRSSQRQSRERSTHRPSSSSTYEPTRKRFPTRDCPSYSSSLENNGRTYRTLSRSDSRRSSHDRQLPYTILTGPKNQSGCVDCQVIIVNMRQREYAEKIESRLSSHGLVTSIIFLREDYSLTQAIDNATRLQCLYGIIAMPMHEERRTASFHILYGQTEEHRNLSLEDGIHIIVTNYLSYKESLHSNETNNTVMYTAESLPSYEYQRETNNHVREEISPPVLTLNDKLPLSMLLCLLADGRQLTLEEIDRVLVYLLEKKAKMLTLPTGTLPPLPAQYANVSAFNHSTNSISSDTRPFVTSDSSIGKTSVSTTEVSSTIAEQIRQFLTTNIVKSNGSIVDSSTQPLLTKAALEKMPDIVKIENPTITQSKNNVQDQSTTQTNFGFQKNETLPVVMPPFNYTAPAVSSTSSTTPFTTPNFPSFNSALKPTTTVNVPNFVSQPSQFFYPIPAPPNVFPSTLNTAAVETTAAILQAYSQFSVQPPSTTSIVGQQLNTQQQQQQQQIRK